MFEQYTVAKVTEKFMEMVVMDTSTLIGVMVWGNLILSVVMQIFQYNSIYCDYKKPIRQISMLRLSYSFGYFLLFMRGVIPDILSVNIGNTILFICMYNESRMIMSVNSLYTDMIRKWYFRLLVVGSIIFNLMSIIEPGQGMLVFYASIMIYALYFVPCLKLIVSDKLTKLRRNMGIFYEVCILILIPRAVTSLLNPEIGLHANTAIQTIFFLILNIFTLTSTLMFFLFLKEKTDKKVEQLANRDDLTGLYNRRYFMLMGTEMLQRCTDKDNVILLFIDLDFFKKTNDRFGHVFGDKVLNEFAKIMIKSTRTSDLCCRYGGEEFAVLLSGVDEEVADRVADRILKGAREMRFEEEPDFCTTVSVGIYYGVPGKSDKLVDYVNMADKAMYGAKENGRDQKLLYHAAFPHHK